MKKLVVCLLLVFVLFFSLTNPVFANKGSGMMKPDIEPPPTNDETIDALYTWYTHQFYVRQAAIILRYDGYTRYADFLTSIIPGTTIRYIDEVSRGVADADIDPYIVSIFPWYMHFHHPWSHEGLWGTSSAGNVCRYWFNEAVTAWRAGNRATAMYYLGLASHMMQDPFVPHRSRLATENGHGNYEAWAQTNRWTYAVSSGGVYTFPVLTGHYTPSTAFGWADKAAHISYDSTYWFRVNADISDGYADDYPYVGSRLIPLTQRYTAGFMRFFFATVGY